MYEGKRVLAIIPARGRNDGIAHMNMRELGGHPLIYYTIRAAKSCDFIDRILVSTENDEIAAYARSHGLDVPFMRPAELAGAQVLMEQIVQHVLEELAAHGEVYDYVLNLYPNAPFKTPELIRRFVEKVGAFDFVIPLFAHKDYFWEMRSDGTAALILDKERTTRQAATSKYEERGGVYAYNIAAGNWHDTPTRRIGPCELTYHESRMVSSVYDLVMLERLVKLPPGLVEEIMHAD